jgi:hypothetical protein
MRTQIEQYEDRYIAVQGTHIAGHKHTRLGYRSDQQRLDAYARVVHLFAYVSIRQHTSAYVRIRDQQRLDAYARVVHLFALYFVGLKERDR